MTSAASTANITAIQQYLAFRLGEESFALNVAQVREIICVFQITRVPQMPDFMIGVVNLRGSVVPVVDLRRKFGMSGVERTRDDCIVVLEVDFGGERTVVGALADSAQEVLDLPVDQIEPPPRMGTQLKTEFILGLGKKDDQFVILLDVDRIFSADELIDLNARTVDCADTVSAGRA